MMISYARLYTANYKPSIITTLTGETTPQIDTPPHTDVHPQDTLSDPTSLIMLGGGYDG